MSNLNEIILRWFNQFAGTWPPLDALARVMEDQGELLYLGLFACFFFFLPSARPQRMRRTVLLAGSAGLVAVGIAMAITPFAGVPRPFVVLEGLRLVMRHVADGSFPSEHMAGAVAFAGVMWHAPGHGARWTFAVTALGMGVHRLYMGAHWPTDLLGSLVIGMVSAWAVLRLGRRLDPVIGWVLAVVAAVEARLGLRPRPSAAEPGPGPVRPSAGGGVPGWLRPYRNLRLTWLAFSLWSLAYNLAGPLLPLYAQELGAEPVQVGLVMAAAAAGAVVLLFPVSALSDRAGRRQGLLAGWLLSAAGVAVMATAGSWTVLLPGAFLAAAALAALPTLNTMVVEESPPHLWARHFALLYSAGPVGLLVGSAAGGLLAQVYGLRGAVVVAAAACLVSVVAVWLVTPVVGGGSAVGPASATDGAEEFVANGRPLVRVLIFSAVAAGGFLIVSLPNSFIVPYLREVGQQTLVATGLYSALLAAAQLGWSALFAVWPRRSGVIAVALGPLQARLPAGTLLAIAVCLVANGAFGLLLPLGLPGAFALGLVMRGSQYGLQSLGSALLGGLVDPGPQRASRMTLAGAGVGVGAVAAPVVAGWLYDLSPVYPFWSSGAASVAGALLLTAMLRRWLPWARPHTTDAP